MTAQQVRLGTERHLDVPHRLALTARAGGRALREEARGTVQTLPASPQDTHAGKRLLPLRVDAIAFVEDVLALEPEGFGLRERLPFSRQHDAIVGGAGTPCALDDLRGVDDVLTSFLAVDLSEMLGEQVSLDSRKKSYSALRGVRELLQGPARRSSRLSFALRSPHLHAWSPMPSALPLLGVRAVPPGSVRPPVVPLSGALPPCTCPAHSSHPTRHSSR